MKINFRLENYKEQVFNLPFFVFRKKNKNHKNKLTKLFFIISAYLITLTFKLLNESILCSFMNAIYKSDGKIKWDSENKVYYKLINKSKIYYPNKYRLSGSMVNHKHELNNLLDSYCLNNFEINKDDIVVDCGANVGAFYLALNQYIDSFLYFGYEPDPNAYNCLNLNLQNYKNVKIFKKGLSNKVGKSNLYLESNYGDSSLEQFNSNEKIEIEISSLDNEEIKNIRLLKIDAEGHELEVLEGAKKMLSRIDFICVDMGSEKGYLNENTTPEVVNFLLNNGFHLFRFNENRTTGLFKNNLII